MAPVGRPRTRTQTGSAPPVTEIGFQIPPTSPIPGSRMMMRGVAPWSTFMDEHEHVPELMWPTSVSTYDKMRTDSQLSALLTAVIYGITQLRFAIDPNGARPSLVQEVSEDLNVTVQGEEDAPIGRMKNRFAHKKHMVMALKAMIWGHMYFEQSGEIVDGKFRLRKLAPRMPHTIGEIVVAPDGGLVAVRQNIAWSPLQLGWPTMPVDRLTAFIFEQEGANWVGRSIMRDCFKNWLIKDQLLRIDAINHDRAGGIPIAEAGAEATPGQVDDLAQMMQSIRVGEEAGGAVPYGTDITALRSGGSSAFDSVRGHDELMARRFLMMVANLAQGGQHVGSYALGEVFQDLFITGQKAIVQWYLDVMNEHVIEDLVDWNYGEEEELAPILVAENMDEVLGTEALAELVGSGVIVMDDELENQIRYRYKLKKRTTPRPDPEAQAVDGGDAGGQAAGAPSQSASPAAAALYDQEQDS